MNELRNKPFAGSAFAENEYIALCGNYFFEGFERLPHGFGVRDKIVEYRTLRSFLFQGDILIQDGPVFQYSPDGQDYLVVKKGFDDIVGGAFLHSLNRGLYRGEGSHHYRCRIGVYVPYRIEHRHSVALSHLEVCDYEVEGIFFKSFYGVFAAVRRGNRVSLSSEYQFESLAYIPLVIHDQYSCLRLH